MLREFPKPPQSLNPKTKREWRMHKHNAPPPTPYLFIGAFVKFASPFITDTSLISTREYIDWYKLKGDLFFAVFNMEQCAHIIAEGGVTEFGLRPLVYQDGRVTLEHYDINIDIGRVTYVGHMWVQETEKGLLLLTVPGGYKVDVFKYRDNTHGSVLIVPALGDCFCSAFTGSTLAVYP